MKRFLSKKSSRRAVALARLALRLCVGLMIAIKSRKKANDHQNCWSNPAHRPCPPRKYQGPKPSVKQMTVRACPGGREDPSAGTGSLTKSKAAKVEHRDSPNQMNRWWIERKRGLPQSKFAWPPCKGPQPAVQVPEDCSTQERGFLVHPEPALSKPM